MGGGGGGQERHWGPAGGSLIRNAVAGPFWRILKKCKEPGLILQNGPAKLHCNPVQDRARGMQINSYNENMIQVMRTGFPVTQKNIFPVRMWTQGKFSFQPSDLNL